MDIYRQYFTASRNFITVKKPFGGIILVEEAVF